MIASRAHRGSTFDVIVQGRDDQRLELVIALPSARRAIASRLLALVRSPSDPFRPALIAEAQDSQRDMTGSRTVGSRGGFSCPPRRERGILGA